VAAEIRVQYDAENKLAALLTSDGMPCTVHEPRVVSLTDMSQGSTAARNSSFYGHGRVRQARRSCCGHGIRLECLVMACPVLLMFVDAFRYKPMDAMTRMTRAAPEQRFLARGQTSEVKRFDSSTGQPTSLNISAPSLSGPRRVEQLSQRCNGFARYCRASSDVIRLSPV
jgi:hypothetical protein